MKLFKRIFTVVATFGCVLCVASCGNNRNTEIPYGSVSDATYASVGKYKVTQKQVYNSIRADHYSDIASKIKQALFAKEIAEVDYANNTDDKEYIDELISSACYSSTTASTLEAMTDDEKKLAQEKYIDKMYKYGVTVTSEELAFNINDEQVSFSNLGSDILNYYIPERAYINAAIAELQTVSTEETIIDLDDEEVDNSFYITDTLIKSEYNDYYKNYSSTRAIVVRFNSARAASLATTYVDSTVGQLTEANKLEYFIALYNYYYQYRTQLTTTNYNTVSDTLYRTDADYTELSSISTGFATFYNNTLEDGDFTAIPRSIDDKYFMALRLETTYKTGTTEPVNYEALESTLGATKKDEILAECRQNIIKKKASSYVTTLYDYRLNDADLVIYDPVFEAQYEKSYDDLYTLTTKSSTDTIFTCTSKGITTTLKVDDFYAEMEEFDGAADALEYLMYDYCYDTYIDEIDEDDLDDLKSSLNSAIKSFKNDNQSYDSEIGLSTWLTITYGYPTKAEVLKYYLQATACTNVFITKYYEDTYFNDDHSINTETQIFKNFLVYTAKQFQELFTIDLDHLLISVDDDCNGNPDDPDEFRSNLATEEDKVAFDNAVTDLVNALTAEIAAIKTTPYEAATYLVTAFNEGADLVSTAYAGKTWDDFKKYNFTLTCEQLGSITKSSASSYVKPFRTYIEEVFEDLVANDVDIDDDKSIVYTLDRDDNGKIDYADICKTEYGFHILMVNEYTEATAPTYTQANDTTSSNGSIKIIVDELDEDDDDDDIYFVTSPYNDSTTNASINQLFIYFYEYNNGGVVSFSFKSTLEDNISAIFDSVIGKFIDTEFRQYLLIKVIGDVTFTSATGETQYNRLLTIKQSEMDSYEPDPLFEGWYDLDWFE